MGDGTKIDRKTPVDVVGLSSGVVQASMGNDFTCALTTAGAVKCWGNNKYYTLGNSEPAADPSPVPVDVADLSGGVTAIAAGQYHACALLGTGGVKCWGSNFDGQLGYYSYPWVYAPVDVLGLSAGAVAITAGQSHNCVLMNTGGIKCWGLGTDGQLGVKKPIAHPYALVDVQGLSSGVTAIAAGDYHTCALLENGGVKCWGEGAVGELGDGTNRNHTGPVDVVGLKGPVIAVAAGSGLTCALMKTGAVTCWGMDITQTTYSAPRPFLVPTDIATLEKDVTSISIGLNHACVIMIDGGVKCWGNNAYGELGNDANSLYSPYVFPPVDVLCQNCGSIIPGATTETPAVPT